MKKTVPGSPTDSPFALDMNHKYLRFRRTKIVATIGPASSGPEMLRRLIAAGINVARVNFSHGDPDEKVRIMRRIREAARAEGTSVAILADLCGPKIRVGKFRGGSIPLREGSVVTITIDPVLGEEGLIPATYRRLTKDVPPGSTILLDDGALELKVLRKRPRALEARVIRGGVLRDGKGMNLPGSRLGIPALTDKDRADVLRAIAGGADYLALSFVRRPRDLLDLRRLLESRKASVPVIAKIEKPEALEHIREIVELADGLMVARGDLGVELPVQKVPLIQNRLIQIASEAGKPVIVATQMLESMVENARPTRAEVSDVAAACAAGADAVMLSAETAAGKHPVEAVRMMDAILRETEAYQFFALRGRFPRAGADRNSRLEEALGTATAQLSRDLMVRAIFVLTRSGTTARHVSADRPAAPILALTPSETVRRRLNLLWGVYPFLNARELDLREYVSRAEEILGRLGIAARGDYVLMLSGQGTGGRGTDSIVVHRVR